MSNLNKLIALRHETDCKAYPSMPKDYVPKTKYTDKTANGLTKCIVDWLNLNGHRADRVSSAGRYVNNSKTVKDVLGRQITIGSGHYIKSSTRNGYADVNATILGRSVMIEIKIGADRMSEVQHKFAEAEISAGGQYWIVKTFDEFMFYYDSFIYNHSKLL